MTSNSNNKKDLWFHHLRQWNKLGPPLRPSMKDIAVMEREVSAWSDMNRGKAPVAFILGVTPEIPAMNWPAGSRVYALDNSIDMVRYIWPEAATYTAGSVVADWNMMPLGGNTVDLALCDGGFSLFSWPDGYASLFRSVSSVLSDGGRLICRFFVRPETRESTDEIFEDLARGRINNFHTFKWRLAMSLHEDDSPGVCVGDVWELWNSRGYTSDSVAAMTGWPKNVIRTMDAYRNSKNRLSFPARVALKSLQEQYFSEISCVVPDYEIGDRCLITTLEKKSGM